MSIGVVTTAELKDEREDFADGNQTSNKESSKGSDLRHTEKTYQMEHEAETSGVLSADFSNTFLMDEDIEHEQNEGKSFIASNQRFC